MKRLSRIPALIIAALLVSVSAYAKDTKVTASTSWVGAIAEAAGASRVDVIAPLDLKHPPEYDYKPSDVKRTLDCDYVAYAGYEGFMKKLIATSGVPASKVLNVYTDNIPATLKEETRKLAAVFGTQERQKQWEKDLDKAVSDIQTAAKAKGLVGKRAVVQAFLAKYAAWMGLKVVGTFGGGEELTPVKMAELIRLKPDMVVDNWHNAMGAGIAAETKAPYAVLINFPGHGGTHTVIDVLKYNASQLGL